MIDIPTIPWCALAPELAVATWILLLLVATLCVPAHRQSVLSHLAVLGIVVAAGLLVWASQHPSASGGTAMLSLDRFGGYFKGLLLLATAVVIVMTRLPRQLLTHVGAFYLLLYTALLGALILVSVNNLLLLFLGLELLTFSLYIMAAYVKTDPRSVEAGMKYLILGSVSSGFLIYGIALLYGMAGTITFTGVRAAFANTQPTPVAGQVGLYLILAGLGFKVAAVPFQLWVPDVYEGAPTPVVAMLSVGSKMAGVVAMLRLLDGLVAPVQWVWTPVLAVISAATMLYGNLGAIPQTNIKRLLGYSSIGHAGYLLMGIATATPESAAAISYYLLAYLCSNLAVFLVVVIVGGATGSDSLDEYRGLSRRSPGLAAAMFIALLSLAGVPPLAGFVGKLLVLLSAVKGQRLWLVAIGAVNVAISLYYYLTVVKRMYLEAPNTSSSIRITPLAAATLAALVLGIVVVGVYQQPFLAYIRSTL